ncbi:MAG: hypothetical protein GPI97_23325 [Microcystis aeruginosa W13-16]|nr:hypothetical protein [Microcystis aeruginosa W13-16]
MKKFVIIEIIFLFVSVLSCATTSNVSQKAQEIKFDVNTIDNFEWHMKGDYFYDWHIKFNKKQKRYTEYFIGEGCGGYDGSYSISNDIIILKKDNDSNDCFPMKMSKNRKCKISIDYDSAISPITLICDDNLQYFNSDIKTEKNILKEINGEQILTLGLIQGKTTDRVKIREKPDVNSKFFKCFEMSEMNVKDYNSLGKNKFLVFIGRSVEKTKVENWNNYWYYVYVATDWYEGCESRYGWIYGEFISFN